MAGLGVMEVFNGSMHGISFMAFLANGVGDGKISVLNSLDDQPHVCSRRRLRSGNMCIN